MTTYYHGTDKEIAVLRAGSYVTRHHKDAEKFGYRRAVSNGSAVVFIYQVDVVPEQTVPDPKRDRAFLVTSDRPVILLAELETFVVEHKLRKFRRSDE
jgi:hypothetical protein